MATDIPRRVRGAVIERARGRCEFCQKPDDRALNPYRHEVDHILAEKHGGDTALDNLAYACFQCNRYKGTDLTMFPFWKPRSSDLGRKEGMGRSPSS